ncbi:MAG: ADP-ribosylglycohydrolase family protein [Promethearchaeia archaeon]
MNLKSKFLGGFIGCALGDAIGEISFFCSNKQELLSKVESSTVVRYTDDTAMAIGLAEALIKYKDKLEPDQLGKIFHKNYNEEPRRGYGMGPPTIFKTVEQTDNSYTEVAKTLFNGSGSYGNGASMRITPLGLFYYDSPDIYEKAKTSAVATHTHPLGIEGAAILAKAVSLVVTKDPKSSEIKEERKEFLATLIDFAQTEEYKNRLNKAMDLLDKDEDLEYCARILGSNVLSFKSVPFSIYAFLNEHDSFKDCLIETALVSEDRDTVGAMACGLSGAYLGLNAIPDQWIQKLENREYIKELAEKLYELQGTSE